MTGEYAQGCGDHAGLGYACMRLLGCGCAGVGPGVGQWGGGRYIYTATH